MSEMGYAGIILSKSYDWWRGHRPVAWSESDHLNNPTINTCTDAEKRLAVAVRDYRVERIRDQQRELRKETKEKE
jgi:hypothetical protein